MITIDEWAMLGIGSISMIVYFCMGFGVSMMTSNIKKRKPTLFDVSMWPMVVLCFAVVGDDIN